MTNNRDVFYLGGEEHQTLLRICFPIDGLKLEKLTVMEWMGFWNGLCIIRKRGERERDHMPHYSQLGISVGRCEVRVAIVKKRASQTTTRAIEAIIF